MMNIGITDFNNAGSNVKQTKVHMVIPRENLKTCITKDEHG